MNTAADRVWATIVSVTHRVDLVEPAVAVGATIAIASFEGILALDLRNITALAWLKRSCEVLEFTMVVANG